MSKYSAIGIEKALKLGTRALAYRATVALGPAEGVMALRDAKFASGVLVRQGNHYFVATADHYFDLVQPNAMTITFMPETIAHARDTKELLRILTSLSNWRSLTTKAQPLNPKRHKRTNKREDVAVLEIDRLAIPRQCWVYDLEQHTNLHQLPVDRERLLVTGMPTLASVISTEKKQRQSQTPESTGLSRVTFETFLNTVQVTDPEKWLSQEDHQPVFDPAYHFALEYDISQVADNMYPGGLSGCGVWRVNSTSSAGGIEIPSPILVGIENHYHKSRRSLKVTSISRVCELIDHWDTESGSCDR